MAPGPAGGGGVPAEGPGDSGGGQRRKAGVPKRCCPPPPTPFHPVPCRREWFGWCGAQLRPPGQGAVRWAQMEQGGEAGADRAGLRPCLLPAARPRGLLGQGLSQTPLGQPAPFKAVGRRAGVDSSQPVAPGRVGSWMRAGGRLWDVRADEAWEAQGSPPPRGPPVDTLLLGAPCLHFHQPEPGPWGGRETGNGLGPAPCGLTARGGAWVPLSLGEWGDETCKGEGQPGRPRTTPLSPLGPSRSGQLQGAWRWECPAPRGPPGQG